MAAVTVDNMTSPITFVDRQTSSPSPLSYWTQISPTSPTAPTANRTIFTIADENAENSPRPPKPELSDLEANGMVHLSSQWTQEVDGNTHYIEASIDTGHIDHQTKPVKRVNFSSSCDIDTYLSNGYQDANDTYDHDDGLVIVTDKITQTEQPWPFLQQTSPEHLQQYEFNITNHSNLNKESLNYNNGITPADNIDISSTEKDIEQKLIQDETKNNTKGNNSTKDNYRSSPPDESNDDKASESPTLKVEYVGKVWDAYINDFLLASDHISEAAIYDKASKSCIACSQQFTMTPEEFHHLLTSINCLSVAYRQGVTINNRHFKTVLADGRRGLMAKGVEHDGCSVSQTRTLVLVAMHDRRSKGRRCNDELMRLGDFFWAKGL